MCLENLHLVFVISAILLYILKKNLNQANKLSTGATYGGRGVELSSELFMLKGANNTQIIHNYSRETRSMPIKPPFIPPEDHGI